MMVLDEVNLLLDKGFKRVTLGKRILRSEASNRFEKGLDPKRTYLAIERSCHLLEKYANATIVDELVEYKIVPLFIFPSVKLV